MQSIGSVRGAAAVIALAVVACGLPHDADDVARADCGNGVVDVGEECDDGNLASDDDCLVGCRLATCGDGQLRDDPADPEDREECDDGAVPTLSCDDDCSLVLCGDGRSNPADGERCDDGNMVSGDGCRADCRSEETCGNGIIDDHLPKSRATNPTECLSATQQGTNCAEVCDDGNTTSGDGCSSNCLSEETCRNGIVDRLGNGGINPPEVCDDGNSIDGDECRNDCQGGVGCGNGLLDAGEQCDQGAAETATCDLSDDPTDPQNCTLALCGDGHRNQLHGESCDPGMVGADVASCDGDCTLPVCGDNRVNVPAGEQCEPGVVGLNTPTCDNDCTVPVCGDNHVNAAAGEQCEDGNQLDTDACVNCRDAVCGDGATRTGVEQCDDSNQNDSDGCRNNCTLP